MLRRFFIAARCPIFQSSPKTSSVIGKPYLLVFDVQDWMEVNDGNVLSTEAVLPTLHIEV